MYINIARKLYSNIFLFQVDASPLEQQKNNREFEVIVQTCIMNTIRDNIPIDHLLKQYMDETQEEDVSKEQRIIKEPEPVMDVSNAPIDTPVDAPADASADVPVKPSISFEQQVEKYDPVNDEKTNEVINFESKEEPRSLYDDEDDDDNYDKLTIGDSIDLNLGEEVSLDSKNTSFDLGVENIVEKDEIDLGVEEIKL